MSAIAAPAPTGPAVTIRGRSFPVMLPKLSDPRLHLAATITSLQVIGQVGFHFEVSVAQILIAIGTAAVIEVAVALVHQRVILWPASALLTGNGVAFVLRDPGTVHGDWWSLRGWWIYVATAAVALLSKYVIRWRRTHVFNPSNIGLVICFLALGRNRAVPLDFWWGPTSVWLAAVLAIIVVGGFAILWRLKLLRVALSFWISFTAAVGVLALAGHTMLTRWHVGALNGFGLWWVLITSPEVLVFLFFMITDPKTAPHSSRARIAYGVSLGLLAAILIAPTTSEFAAKVMLLVALAIVSLALPLLRGLSVLFRERRLPRVFAPVALAAAVAAIVVANATPVPTNVPRLPSGPLPPIQILPARGNVQPLDRHTAELIAYTVLKAQPSARSGLLRIQGYAGTGQGPPSATVRSHKRAYFAQEKPDGRWVSEF